MYPEVKKSALRSSRQSWSTITDPRSMFYSDHRSPIPQLVRRITDPTSPIHFSKSCCHLFKSPQQQKKVVWDYFWSKIRIHYFVSKERLLRLLLVENKNLLLRQKKKFFKPLLLVENKNLIFRHKKKHNNPLLPFCFFFAFFKCFVFWGK